VVNHVKSAQVDRMGEGLLLPSIGQRPELVLEMRRMGDLTVRRKT
jgi:hypothetical protein